MRWKSWIIAGLVLGVLAATSFGSSSKGEKAMTLELKSAAFTPGSDIPKKFTCDGPDVSPALSWSELPANTQSISLIMDDPDAPAGTWVHWVLYDLPATMRELPENVPKDRELKNSARQGSNDFGRIGYGGPGPPPGPAHRHFFQLYAPHGQANPRPGGTQAELERGMKRHIPAQGGLVGPDKRQP